MIRYLIRRMLSTFLILMAVTGMLFLISYVVPVDAARVAAGPYAGAEQVESLRRAMGLDRPVLEQYLRYVRGLMSLDLGRSVRTQFPVRDDLLMLLPATLELITFSFAIYAVLGIAFGLLAAITRDSFLDLLIRTVSILGSAIPLYVLGLWLLYLFFFEFRWFPSGGRLDILSIPPPRVTSFYLIDSLLAGDFPLFLSTLHHLALPAITLVLGLIAVATRLTRTGVLNELKSKYVEVARLKGLPESDVVVKHALRNSLIPVVTLMGVQLGYLVGGTVIVETVFQWPGIGLYMFRSISAFDYIPVIGVTLVCTFIFVNINFLLDLLYPVLDPRIVAWGERR